MSMPTACWYVIGSTSGDASLVRCSLANTGVLIRHSPIFSNLSSTLAVNFSWERLMVPFWQLHVTQMPRIQFSSPRSVILYLCLSTSLSLLMVFRSLDAIVISSMYNAMMDMDGFVWVKTAWLALVHWYPICLRVFLMSSYHTWPPCFVPYTAFASLRTIPLGMLKPGGGSM